MYVKLAFNNARRSMKDYIIYFVTLVICVSLFYGFMSLSSADYELITEDTYSFDILKIMIKYTTYVVTGLLIVLIGYVNAYMIRRRKKEFATYILLGVPQKSVALMFFIEMLTMGVLSIAAGIFIGTLFSQLVTALILMTAKQPIVFTFRLYVDTVGITFLFFMVMFCIIGLFNVRTLSKTRLIHLLNDEKKTEIQFKHHKGVYFTVFVMSMLLYGLCGFSVHHLLGIAANPELKQGDEIYYVQMALFGFILGTYALFYALAYILIWIKERWTAVKYQYTNLFLIGTVVSKIKTAPVLMATISLTFLGAALSFTLTLLLSQWSLGYLEQRIPFDTIVATKSDIMVKEEAVADIDYSGLISYLKEEGITYDDVCEVEQYYIFEIESYDTDMNQMPLYAIGLSDYNHLRQMRGISSIELEPNTFTTQWMKGIEEHQIESYLLEHQMIQISGSELTLGGQKSYKAALGEYIYNGFAGGIIVLPDAWCENLAVATKDLYAITDQKISNTKMIELEGDLIPNWFKESYGHLLNGDKKNPLTIRLKAAETNEILNVTLGMRILGIYGGTVLLMISLTVLSLQQLSDSIEHSGRYNTLRKLGIDTREIHTLILKQISLYFAAPIVVAIFGFYIFFSAFKKATQSVMALYIGDRAFMFNITVSLVLIVIIYLCYFATTYYTFKRNVDTPLSRS